MSGDAVLIGFILSMAAGFFLQPYVAKIRWPKFEAKPEALHITWETPMQRAIIESKPMRRAIGVYAESVQRTAIEYGVLNVSEIHEIFAGRSGMT